MTLLHFIKMRLPLYQAVNLAPLLNVKNNSQSRGIQAKNYAVICPLEKSGLREKRSLGMRRIGVACLVMASLPGCKGSNLDEEGKIRVSFSSSNVVGLDPTDNT